MNTIKEKLVDTVSAVNYNNGIVRMALASREAGAVFSEVENGEIKIATQAIMAMPLSGFLYAYNVMSNFLDDPKMKDHIKKLEAAGLLGESSSEAN